MLSKIYIESSFPFDFRAAISGIIKGSKYYKDVATY